MASNPIIVNIGANAGPVTAAIQATTKSTESLGVALDQVNVEAKTAGRGISEAMESRHAVMLMTEQFGVHMPRAIAGMISSLGPLGPLLAAAFPIIAVTALVEVIGKAIEKHEQLAAAVHKAAEENENLTIKERDRTAGLEVENLKLEDQIAKIENRPSRNKLAEALLDARIKADGLASSLNDVFEKTGDELEGQTSGWSAFKSSVEGTAKALFSGGGGAEMKTAASGAYVIRDAYKAVETQIERINEARLKLSEASTEKEQKDAINALKDAYGGYKEAAEAALSATRSYTPDAQKDIAQLQQSVITATNGLRDMNLQAQNTALSLKLVNVQETADGTKLRLEVWKDIQKVVEDNKKLITQMDEASAKLGDGALKAQLDAEEKINTAKIDSYNAQLKLNEAVASEAVSSQQDVINHDKVMGLKRQQVADEQKLVTLLKQEEASQLAIIDAKMEAAAAEMEVANGAGDTAGYQTALAQYTEYQAERIKIAGEADRKIGQAQNNEYKTEGKYLQEYLGKFNQEFSSSFASVMTGQETLGKAAQKMFMSMETAALQSFAKMALAELEGLALHKTIGDQQKLTDAKRAFHGTYAALAGVPIIGPIIAPIAAAGAFATVMAFEEGGVVPDTQMAMVHKNEMVLPSHLSETFQNLAEQGVKGGGGGDVHIHAMDASSFHSFLKRNPSALAGGISHATRTGHLNLTQLQRGK